METILSNFIGKSKRGFLQTLALLVLVSVSILNQPALAQTTPQAPCTLADIDRDDDGLIEICDLEGLNAIRYQADGSGYQASAVATKITAGCARGGCKGYELNKDLDFDSDASYSNVANKARWTTGLGWQPIGHNWNSFRGTFEGNGYTISNLTVNRLTFNDIGLFGYMRADAEIINVGLLDVDIQGFENVGGLVGYSHGSSVKNSYVMGSVIGDEDVGGLVGENRDSSIKNSYVMGSVEGRVWVGGLTGWNVRGDITNSYAAGAVKGNSAVGGLIGSNIGDNIRNSYWDKTTSRMSSGSGGVGKTTTELQSPTTATGIYSSWSTNNWDFGTREQYPVLKYRDGTLMPNQRRDRLEELSQLDILNPTSCSTADRDQDNDGLIEICNLEGLDAIRYQLDGSGYRASESATKITAGCAESGCKGYELIADLDFDDDASYSNVANKVTWTTGSGWQPIGTSSNPFNAIFRANKYSISKLMIARSSLNQVGLFKKTGNQARIEGVGLIDADVRGDEGVGGLVGYNSGGTIINSYVTGIVRGDDSVGGLVGDNYGPITNSYTNVEMSGDSWVGGIIGCNFSGGIVTNSYTVPRINRSSSSSGGLLGANSGSRSINSYWDKEVSGISSGDYGVGLTTAELQSPITSTGIYSRWSTNAWDFGSNEQYPALKYRDGTLMPNQGREIPEELPQIEIVGVPAGAVDEGERITLTASSTSNANNIPLIYQWRQTSGRTLLTSPTSGSRVTLDVPEDYVMARATTSNLVLTLGVSSDVGSNTQQISITITKRNNGGIAALGIPSLNERELTAPSIDLSGDLDGIGSNIRYKWQIRQSTQTAWVNVQTAGTSERYTIPADTTGIVEYRVVVSYTDGQGYRERVASEASIYEGNTIPSIEIASLTSCGTADIDQDDDGLIEICNLEGLNAMRHQLDGSGYRASSSTVKITAGCAESGCKGYELNKDLDFNDDASYRDIINKEIWTEDEGWKPVGYYEASNRTNNKPFTANFEGNNHIISNLMIDRSNTNNVGLFGFIERGNINNVGLSNINIKGNRHVSGLVSRIWQGTITNSYVTGNVTGGHRVGGLVGENWEGTVRNSYTTGDVVGGSDVGGLVSHNSYGRVINSYAMSDVAGNSNVGGLAGNHFYGTIRNSYATGNVTGDHRVGGLVGHNWQGPIMNSYWDKTTSGMLRSARGVGKTTTELQSPITSTGIYSSWSANDWDFGTREQYPALKYSDGTLMPNQVRERPEELSQVEIASLTSCGTADIDQDDDGLIEICDLEGLNAMRHQMDGSGYRASASATKITAGCAEDGCKGYELNKDLDFDDDASYSDVANKTTWTTGSGWNPIGTSDHPFDATFRANKYSISKLMIARPSHNNVGLFGNMGNQARIEGIGLIDVDIRGNWGVGGLAGYNSGGTILNSYVIGLVRGQDSIGGLVGDNYGPITNSYTNVEMSGNNYVGGMAGCNFSGGIVTNSYAIPRISSSFTSSGGLLGYDSSGSLPVNSYWDKDVSGISSGNYGVGLTTEELQSPITSGSTSTEIYYGWSNNNWDFGTSEQYPALKYRDGTLMPKQRRELPQMPQIEIAGVPTGAVNEGERITLTASSASSASSIPLIYQWRQTSGRTLLTNPTSGSRVTLNVPEDYVVARATTSNLVLTLGVSSDVGSNTQQISITITKRNNGGIAALGVPTLNERELTAPSIDLSGDLDGIGSNIRYKWQIRQSTQTAWVNVQTAGTSERYTIPADTTGIVEYRVVVSYTDGQGYRERVASEASIYEGNTIPSIEIASLTSCGTADIDQDDDGLIEICNLEGLNAMRHQLDGSGYRASSSTVKITAGCAESGCKGYELNKDLDFNDDASYRDIINKEIWTEDEGWKPVGYYEASNRTNNKPFTANFEGNNHIISNLMIDRSNTNNVGLFGFIERGNINNVGLSNINIKGNRHVSGLVSRIWQGTITNSYVTGNVTGGHRVGGLVGENWEGTVRNSYTTGDVVGGSDVGGLVSHNSYGRVINSYAMSDVAGNSNVGGLAGNHFYGTIRNSYATGNVTGDHRVGGLVGHNWQGPIMNSYWDKTTSGMLRSARGVGKTTTELQSPITSTGIYSSWSTNDWDFGTREQYPALKYSDGTLMPNQVRERPEELSQVEIASLTSCGTADIDQDNDGLIEICDLEGLNAMRHQMDGSGYRASASATKITAGCAEDGCKGYELNKNLDFDDDASYSDVANKTTWTTGSGWNPIGTSDHPFDATFRANKYSISKLMIARPSHNNVGLFGNMGNQARIEGIGLIDVDIRGSWGVGGLAGYNSGGTILNSYVIGLVRGQDSIGGLVGDNYGPITNSYTNVEMSGNNYVGGMAGCNFSGGIVTNSYAIPRISSSFTSSGGLLGYDSSGSLPVNSYWDKDVSGISSGNYGVGLTTEELQSPITSGSTSTEIYYGWSNNNWDFGTSEQYPALKHSDGTLMPKQRRELPQMPQIEIAGVPTGAVNEGERITLTASSTSSASSIPLIYQWHQTSGKTLLTNPTSGSRVTLNVPEDYVMARATTSNLVLTLRVSNDVDSNTHQVSITIAKRNNGGIAALGIPNLNERELTAPSIDSSGDPDGGGNNIGYQWQIRENTQTAWANVPAAGTNERYTIPADTAGIVEYRVVVSYTDGQGYRERVASEASIYEGNTIPSVEIAGVPVDAVNEGERITLTAFPHNSENNILPSYSWTQTSGKTLLTSPTSGSRVTLDVPEDYVSASENTGNVVLILEASNDVGSTAQQVLITIAKRNNGGIAALGVPTLNERELTAPSIDLSGDPDGIGSNIRYKWQSRQSAQTEWVNVPASRTNERYIIPADTAGIVEYRVVVSYIDGQGYRERVASEASIYEGNTIPSVEIAGVPAAAMNEGEQITLTAFPHNSENDILPSYSWTQTLGKTLLTGPTSGSRVILDVPEDYVSASKNTGNVVLILEASNDVGSTTQQVSITIAKHDNGGIAALGIPNLNERELTAPSIDLSGDPDGSGNNIRYQWQSRQSTQTAWIDVSVAGTNARYTIPADTAGIVEYRVVVRYTDGQGYGEEVLSGAVIYERINIASLTSCSTTDIDQDDDGLIEICDLEGLNAIRYQMDGSGYRASLSATKITAGCAEGGCKGYELNKDLDFDNDASYRDVANKATWTTGSGWQPLRHTDGDYQSTTSTVFNAVFEGNNHTLSNLMINRSANAVGLFGKIGNQARLNSVGLIDVDVRGNWGVGGLAGHNSGGAITNSYVIGSVQGNNSIGGLVGDNYGPITNSYTNVEMLGNNYVGGIVGCNFSGGIITNSYTVSLINRSFSSSGGLLGYDSSGSEIANSYWDKDVSGISSGDYGVGLTTEELQAPTTSTGIYSRWSIRDWDFGTREQYPALKYRDGTLMPNQRLNIVNITSCGIADIDQDNDGLIEICDLEGLSAIRYQRDGSGYRTNGLATKITTGCAEGGCKGYELARDLDFSEDASYTDIANKATWTTGEGWEPIGSFGSIFDGNGYTISHLMINRSTSEVGLFGSTVRGAEIVNAGLLSVDVQGNDYVGGLVGFHRHSSIANSYAMGSVQGVRGTGVLVGYNWQASITSSYAMGSVEGRTYVGSLVGDSSYSNVTNSYATGSVNGHDYTGGLVGDNWYSDITNSYAIGSVVGIRGVGGLTGRNTQSITNSYWDKTTSGMSGNDGGEGKTTTQLQSPTGATGIYSSWSTNDWDFGTREQYPALKYSDGTLIPNQGREMPEEPAQITQIPQVEIAGVPTGAVDEGERITLTASSTNNANNIPLIYQWRQTSGKTLLTNPTSGNSVTLNVPEDYVAARASIRNLRLTLRVSNEVGSTTTHRVSITIAKRNNGGIAALGVPSLNERELTAPSINLGGDPDGGGSNVGYQWQSRQSTQTAWVDVPTVANTKETYTIPEETRNGTQYRVVMSYTDGQGYREEVVSGAMIYERRVAPQPSIEIASLTSCGTADIDQDDDGLIEICNLEGLDAIRYQVDGSGYRASVSATKITAGCAESGCRGYELSKDLDFNDEASYSSTSNKVIWTTGAGWNPIGHMVYDGYLPITTSTSFNAIFEGTSFNAIFEGNNHTISNLMIARSTNEVGLFGRIGSQARLNSVGLINVDVRGGWGVGGLAGYNTEGTITNSYVIGSVRGDSSIGGLVGDNYGPITNSYTNVEMSGNNYVGGIAGCNFSGGIVTNSYTVPRISSSFPSSGGLLGYDSSGSLPVNSYWDKEVSGISSGYYGIGLTTEALQSPTTATGIYSRWSVRDWDFGTREQYPALKHRDGTLMPNQVRERPEEPVQIPQIEIAGVPAGAVDEGERIILTASSTSSASDIPLIHQWQQTSGEALLIEHIILNSVAINVPKDYVTARANTDNVVLMLGISNNVGNTTQQVSITIAKRNNGGIAALGVPSLNERELTAPSINLSGDPDGIGSNIRYQWQSKQGAQTEWINVPAAGTNALYTIPANTADVVQYRVVVSYTDGQGYEEQVESGTSSYRGNTIPSVEIAGVPAGAVGEGERITLTASSHNSDNNILPSYSWTQTSGKTLLIVPTSGNRVTLDVPEDYVAASENTGDVMLTLEASNDVGSTVQQVSITIAKRNNGGIAALGVPTLNERELTAPSINLSGDPDGSGGNIRYQWQSKQSAQTEWINVPAAGTNARYIIPADTAGVVQYRVVVSYTDGQGYEEQVESGTSSYKGNTIPSVEIVGVPTDAVNEGEQITLTASPHNSDNNVLPSYSWTQTSGKTLLIGPTRGNRVTLDVPEDYVATSENTGNVVLILEASNDVGSTAQQVLITIAKSNNGGIAALGVPSLNERELTAPSIDISGDPDGSGNNIRYQWQSKQGTQTEWVNVPAAGTNALHIIPANTAGVVQYRVVVSYTDGQGYEEQVESGTSSYKGNTIPSVEIVGVPTDAVNEGEQITLTASPHNSDNNILPSYSWTQTSGKTLLTSPTSGSRVTLDVPEDYVVASENTGDVVLILEASNDVGSTVQQVSITIVKRNNGGIAALGVPSLNERELTAPSIDLSDDPDGIGSNIRYQWQSKQGAQTEWVNVPAAGTNALYIIPANTAGVVQYRVVVSYTDGQGYEEQVESGTSSYKGNTIPSVEIAGVPVGAVDEGEQITLTASPHNSGNNILPSYSWTQTSGKTLLTSPTSGSRVTLDVPEDYVVASENTGDVVLTLEASNDVGSTVQQVSITIVKRNNGGIAALGVPSLNERELTAPSIDLSDDPDGIGSNIRYQWQSKQGTQTEWVNVPAAGTNALHIIPANTAGVVQYRVVVSYTDGQGYEEQVESGTSSYKGNTIPSVEIAGVPVGAVDEGEQITLTASPHNSGNNILPSYSWTQTSGKTLLISSTSGSSVTLEVPEDYVVASENTGDVMLTLEVSNDVGSTIYQVSITIAKRNNGGIAALGVPSLNERELTAPSIDISGDPDGSGNNIRYQWQSKQGAQTEWVNVPVAGTNERYIIPADTEGIVQYRVVVSYTDGQGYEEQVESGTSSYKGNTIPSVEIAGVPVSAVNEGEQITLTASPHNSDNNVLPSYSWTQTSGKTLLIGPTRGSSVTLDVPEDYVVASENTGNVMLILEASNDVGSTAQQVLITIAKRNNGGITVLGVPSLNERELTAPSIDLSGDPDGIGSNIRYQWQSKQGTQTEWVNVPVAGTNALYIIPANTEGIVQYRVVMSYTDGQGYEEQVESGTSSYRGNTSPSIELPGSVRLLAGQTTVVSVVISEVDVSDVVTLTIELTSAAGTIHVEPNRRVLGAGLSETRTTQFQLTAEQVGSAKLLLTAVDDSQTVTDRSDAVELTVEVEVAPFTSCGYVDIDRDNDGLIEICNLEGLNAMRNQLFGISYKENVSAPEITTGCAEGGCKGYELVKDLDFNDEGSYKDIANKAIWTTGEGWQPIGVRGNGFSSIFEGNNNTISNLMIDRSLANNVGLFGVVDGQPKINGIGLLDVDINAQSRVGGLAGYITSGDITNSYVTGNVIGQLTVGGLVGQCSYSRVSNSYAIGRVEAMGTIDGIDAGSSSAVGGLVGYLLGSSVSRSHAIGSVKGVGDYAGGLIGSNTGRNGSIIASYAFVDVEGGNNYTGGLVGSNNGINNKISNSYAIGKVTGENVVGGLAGHNRSRNTITNSYSFSNVKGSSQVGGLVGNNVGRIINSYAVGRVAGNVEQRGIGGLVGLGFTGGTNNSYWDKTTSGRATSVGGVGQTTAQLQAPTLPGSTPTEVYHGWSEEIWDFGTSKQYPALKYSDGTLMPDQRIGLLSLSALTTEEVSFIFNTEVFDYRLLIDSEVDAVQLLPTATRADANINIVSDSDFSESVASGTLSPAIPLSTTGTTIVTIEVEFASGANRVYRITISRAEQSSPAQLVGVNAPFEHTIPMSIMMDSDNNMREYEVVSMPSWLERIELKEGLMFSGTPEKDHMDTPSEHTIEIRIDNGDGTTQMLSLVLQIDIPTTGTIKLIALPDGILQLDDKLKDDNGIEKKVYIWEHCPVGASAFSELEGVNGMSYELPSEGSYVEAGTAYRVRTTIIDSLGQRSEYTAQIELPERAPPEPVIRIRTKIFLEGFLK